MLVYGGIQGSGAASQDYFADTHILDLNTNTWTEVNVAGPGKLRGAISFYSKARDAVYLWGGKQVTSYPTELWRFDVAARVWETVPVDGEAPIGREDPAFFWDEERQELTLFSGRNDNREQPLLSDAHRLDLADGRWNSIVLGEAPPARWRSTAVFDPSSQTGMLFGGWLGFGGPDTFDDTWLYDTAGPEWSEVIGLGIEPATATAYDDAGNPIGTVESRPATRFADPANVAVFDSRVAISRISFSGGVIDDFRFALPEPKLALLQALALGWLSALRRRHWASRPKPGERID
jgi:hypothetical protein